jgi:hypothetical protein
MPDIDWDGLNGTSAVLERDRIEGGELYAIWQVAGLQYYAYGKFDDVLPRKVIP